MDPGLSLVKTLLSLLVLLQERMYLNNLVQGKDTLIFRHLQDHLKLHITSQVKNKIPIMVVIGWLKLFAAVSFARK